MFDSPIWYAIYHHALIVVAAAVCLFGTWVGMRHFARARATTGPMHYGWVFMASLGTGAALWAAIFISILSQAPSLDNGFEMGPTAFSLLIAIVTCAVGFEIGSKKNLTLAPEIGGVIVGGGILTMHYVGLNAWHVAGVVTWSWFGVGANVIFGFGLGALSVSRANRPVTKYCRHGAAIVMTFAICVMHYTMVASHDVIADNAIELSPSLVPGHTLAIFVTAAVLLVIGSGFSSYFIDLRSRTEAAERIHHLSFNDTMTGLPNRIAFNERLSFDVSDAHEKAHKLAAFSIDIDGFKDINDVFGHAVGDLVLIQAAERMRRALRDGEFLARQSGDEFLALQMSGNMPHTAQEMAARIAAALDAPFKVRDKSVKLTASIGYSIFPTDTQDKDHLLSNAKLAMYRGKTTQRGMISKYDHKMDESARDRRALARDLHDAVKNGELELHYQLQTSLADGSIRGSEALMRWRHPMRGLISPLDFIPLAEESELIIPMGEWALRRACRDMAEGKLPGVVAVNLSPVQFKQNDLVETIHSILVETGVSPQRLEVEVTESTMMGDQNGALHTLRKLKAMGIAIAMDDFGTGYSSLATLHAFPFDKIKLDQSFVQRIPLDVSAMAIVRTILALGKSLGVPVLAEGIETEEQLLFLASEGCKEGQGYLMARPVPLDKMLPAVANIMQRAAQPAARIGASIHAAIAVA